MVPEYQLLPALQALLKEKHVSRAASRVGLTQSAMSRVLGRLRAQFDDPLLVRQGSDYQLTPRAEGLRKELGRLIPELERLWSPPDFEPANIEQKVVISGTDMDVALMAPALQKMHKEAPGMEIVVMPNTLHSLKHLSRGELDFAITAKDDDKAGLHRQTLLVDDFVALVDERSPLTRDKLDLDTYLEHSHGVFSISDQHHRGMIDAALAGLGHQRNISIRLPSFAQMPPVLIGSELIFSVPRSFARYLASRYPIKLLPIPIEVAPIKIYLYWHQRQHKSPLHQWIREIILSVAQERQSTELMGFEHS